MAFTRFLHFNKATQSANESIKALRINLYLHFRKFQGYKNILYTKKGFFYIGCDFILWTFPLRAKYIFVKKFYKQVKILLVNK